MGSGKIKKDGTVQPLDVKVGDRIIFGKYAGTKIKMESTGYLLMKEEDILAVTL